MASPCECVAGVAGQNAHPDSTGTVRCGYGDDPILRCPGLNVKHDMSLVDSTNGTPDIWRSGSSSNETLQVTLWTLEPVNHSGYPPRGLRTTQVP